MNLGKRDDLEVAGTADGLAGILVDLGSLDSAGNLDLGKSHHLKLREPPQNKSLRGKRL